jgi:alkyl sulfatase BDS1-like metallo-beta-lactamase superfamily hydrolase
MLRRYTVLAAASLSVMAASSASAQDPTDATVEANDALREFLPFEDESDFEDAMRGRIATLDAETITGPEAVAGPGGVVYDLTLYDFLEGEAPETANPSLWRQSRLNAINGLFEVVPGIYQIRGFDLANMSFIRGDTGWIVVDPLTANETAEAGLRLLRENVEDLPVSGVIITHSHADHFGGVKGIITPEEIEERNVPVVAPEGFFEEAVSENLLAGNTMSRRAGYMYGNLLEKGPRGTLGSGLGTTTAAGTFTIVEPTIVITETPTELTVDGIEMTFLNTPGAEAPAELMFYIHPFEAMMQAEIINHTLHNLYTLRGAKVRSGDLFAKYINDTINRFGDTVEVSFGSHHWPKWGNEEIVDFWEGQRDTYRYIHDETLRLANQGETMLEIAEQLELPESLATRFANRGYYGSVSHNAKAQYQLYFGWFSGNPAELEELPPAEEGRKFVEYAGGADAVIERARQDFEEGEYRWVATALNHVVFADPENQEARNLLADTLTQMGYQAESGPWRNFYLSGAKELRDGVVRVGTPSTASPDVVRSLPIETYLDYLAVRLNHPEAAQGDPITLNFVMPDADEEFIVTVTNGVLNYTLDRQADAADATVTLDRTTLDDINLGVTSADQAVAEGLVTVDGDADALGRFVSLLDTFDFWFEIVTP